jgi:predicted patatin/cPLA2 family phospholipase
MGRKQVRVERTYVDTDKDRFWRADHPVLALMRGRLRARSQPGHRADAAKLGLAVEGGGMRAIVSAAMLGVLAELGYTSVFDVVYGGSAGALNGAYFLAGDTRTALRIYLEDLASRRFVDFRRPLRGRPIFNLDYVFDEVVGGRRPLAYEKVLASPVPLVVSISLVDQIEPLAESRFPSVADLREALRAGCWLPIATKGTARFRGRRAIDGGALCAHPIRLALADGCTHVLSLSTLPRDYRYTGVGWLERVASCRMALMRRGLGRAFLAADRQGGADREALRRWRTEPVEPAVLDLAPPERVDLTRHDIDRDRLRAAARTAAATMTLALTGVPDAAAVERALELA